MLKKVLLGAYFLCRLPLLFLLKTFAPNKPGGEPRRILVIRLDRLGDFVLFLPVFAGLRAKFPRASIEVMVTPYLKGFAGLVPEIDAVIEYKSFFSAVRKVSREGYDLVIDGLHDYGLKSALVAYFSKAGQRIGFAAGFRELLFTRNVKITEGRHMVDSNLELLATVGAGTDVSRVPRLRIDSAPGPGKAVILHPGGNYPSQRWPAEFFIRLGKELRKEFGGEILVIGGRGERALVTRVAEGIGEGAKALLPEIRELPGVIASGQLFVGNNSGPLHLANALGIPAVSVMGPTDHRLFSPVGKDNIVLRRNVPCSPCSRAACVGHRCLKEISPEEVTAAALSLLKRTPQ